MATAIRSTALDFDNIKNNLKTYLAAQPQFSDYNFEASGLSNILDVLAYNTHINALIANFALNESYLTTAQLRSSVVSIAEGIGYVPGTDVSSQAKLNISFTTSQPGRDPEIYLPAYTQFTTEIDSVTYTFQTVERFRAVDDGTGFYEFLTEAGSNEIPVYEGTRRSKTFIVGEYEDNPVYVIPDTTLDSTTVTVNVFESVTGTQFTTYQNIINATAITENSTIYILKEAPNGYFELSFGDGETFGRSPVAGNKIVVDYLSTNGALANGGTTFEPSTQLVSGGVTATLSVITLSVSTGGQAKESIESIRKNAPFQYATQNRMVTAQDYTALILKNYASVISDIKAWGGEDNLDPEFGAVYVSILFNDDVTDRSKATTKLAIVELADQLAILSFRVRFTDPETTYIEVDNFFQYNPRLTSLTVNTIQANVREIIQNYFDDTVGGFEESFRRSNLLSLIDESDQAILSSRANIRMQKRFTPTTPSIITTINTLTNFTLTGDLLNQVLTLIVNKNFNEAASIIAKYSTTNYTVIRSTIASVSSDTSFNIFYPVPIAIPDDDTFAITSSSFVYNGVTCRIQNKLSSNTLQIVAVGDQRIIVDNIGNYNASTGVVSITYFTPTTILGGVNYIKLSAVPANESAIAPVRNNILAYDPSASFARGVQVTATN